MPLRNQEEGIKWILAGREIHNNSGDFFLKVKFRPPRTWYGFHWENKIYIDNQAVTIEAKREWKVA